MVMEKKLGRKLRNGEVVDHWDRDRSNNRRGNLRLRKSRAAHVKEHYAARDRLVDAQATVRRLRAENRALRAELAKAQRYAGRLLQETEA